MEVIELVDEMQTICEKLRQDGKRIRLIPTMGALHIGHASLIETAATADCHSPGQVPAATSREEEEEVAEEDVTLSCDDGIVLSYGGKKARQGRHNGLAEVASDKSRKVTRESAAIIIVSIFTNPTQFDRATDFEKYPKTDEADLKLCKEMLVDYVFKPSCQQIYPTTAGLNDHNNGNDDHYEDDENHHPYCMVEPPTRLNNDLEGKSRIGHFRGMLTIVCKLFNIVQPHEAYFGEKDYQQMVLVKRMCKDLNMNVCIRPVATIRDPDLLPLSSRNIRLSCSERQAAPFMYQILQDTKQMLESNNNNNNNNNGSYLNHLDSSILASLLTSTILASEDAYNLVHTDYLQLRCSKDFSKIERSRDQRFFDCLEGCVRTRACSGGKGSLILKTRLLISCVIGNGQNESGIRLLDNVEVILNKNLVTT